MQGLQRLHLAAQGGFAGWRGEGGKNLGEIESAGRRGGAEVLSIGDKGDIIVNGSINLEDLEDFEMSSGELSPDTGDAMCMRKVSRTMLASMAASVKA